MNFPIPSSMTSPIGIFDSGVGGLSVLHAIRAQMPEA
jgi:glutamate racemase